MTRCHPRSVHVADIDATRHPVDPTRQPGPDAKTHAIFVWRHGVSPADAARAHPAARPWKAALVADGIPYTPFEVGNIEEEHARLSALGVRFTQPPTCLGGITTAVLDDTCGNLIQIMQIA